MALRRKLIFTVEDSEFRRHDKEVRNYVGRTKKSFKGLGDTVDKQTRRMSGLIKGLAAGVAVAIGGTLINALRKAGTVLFELGSAVEETESKFNTVFQGVAERVDRFADSFANMAGLTRTQGRDFLATTGAIVQGMGAGIDASAELSEEIVRLSGDLASFNNAPIEEAFGAIRSGITGESEPLKRFGIILSEQSVSMEALARTGKASAAELTNFEKVQARLAIITAGAGKALGDLERTQESAANKARALTARLREQREEFAAKLLPAYQQLLDFGEQLVTSFSDTGEALGTKLAAGINAVVFDLVTFAEQVRNVIGAVKSLSSELDLSFLGGGGNSLSVIEAITAELGRMANIVIGIQRGFLEVRILSAKLNASIGTGSDKFVAELEKQSQALLDQQIKLVSLVEERRKTRRDLLDDSGGSDASGGTGAFPAAVANAVPDASRQVVEVARVAAQELSKIRAAAAEVIPVDFLETARANLEDFQALVLSIENDFAAGIIDAEKFGADLDKASQGFIDRMSVLRETLKNQGLLTPALEKLFNQAFKSASAQVKDTADEVGKVSMNLRGILSSGRAVINLASSFGNLSSEVESFARGVLDAVDNLDRLLETRERLSQAGELQSVAGVAAQASSVIGIAAGITQALGGLFEDNGRSMAELTSALRDNARSIRASIESLLLSDRIGADVSGQDAVSIETAFQVFNDLRGEIGDVGGTGDFSDGRDRESFARLFAGFNELLSSLADSGVPEDLLRDVGERVAANLELGKTLSEAIAEALDDEELGLAGILESITGDLGGFGASVEGAVASVRFFADFLGEEAPAQLRRFVDFLTTNIDNLPDELRTLLVDAGNQDVTTEEGRTRIAEIVALIATAIDSGSLELGSLSTSDVEEILQALQSFSDSGESLQGSARADGLAVTTQFQRTVTVIQADRMIQLLQGIEFWSSEIARAVGVNSNLILPGSAADVVEPTITVPDSLDSASLDSGFIGKGVANLKVDVDVTLTPSDTAGDDLMTAILQGLETNVRERMGRTF